MDDSSNITKLLKVQTLLTLMGERKIPPRLKKRFFFDLCKEVSMTLNMEELKEAEEMFQHPNEHREGSPPEGVVTWQMPEEHPVFYYCGYCTRKLAEYMPNITEDVRVKTIEDATRAHLSKCNVFLMIMGLKKEK